MTYIIGIVLLSYVLIAFEAIVPGGVLGLLGLIGLFIAAYLAHAEFGGWFAPALTFLGSALGAMIIIFIEFKWLSKSRIGQKLFLSSSVKGSSNQFKRAPDLVGEPGHSLTDLHPEGIVLVKSKKYDAYSTDGFLPKGSSVKVTGMDDFRIRVSAL